MEETILDDLFFLIRSVKHELKKINKDIKKNVFKVLYVEKYQTLLTILKEYKKTLSEKEKELKRFSKEKADTQKMVDFLNLVIPELRKETTQCYNRLEQEFGNISIGSHKLKKLLKRCKKKYREVEKTQSDRLKRCLMEQPYFKLLRHFNRILAFLAEKSGIKSEDGQTDIQQTKKDKLPYLEQLQKKIKPRQIADSYLKTTNQISFQIPTQTPAGQTVTSRKQTQQVQTPAGQTVTSQQPTPSSQQVPTPTPAGQTVTSRVQPVVVNQQETKQSRGKTPQGMLKDILSFDKSKLKKGRSKSPNHIKKTRKKTQQNSYQTMEKGQPTPSGQQVPTPTPAGQIVTSQKQTQQVQPVVINQQLTKQSRGKTPQGMLKDILSFDKSKLKKGRPKSPNKNKGLLEKIKKTRPKKGQQTTYQAMGKGQQVQPPVVQQTNEIPTLTQKPQTPPPNPYKGFPEQMKKRRKFITENSQDVSQKETSQID